MSVFSFTFLDLDFGENLSSELVKRNVVSIDFPQTTLNLNPHVADEPLLFTLHFKEDEAFDLQGGLFEWHREFSENYKHHRASHFESRQRKLGVFKQKSRFWLFLNCAPVSLNFGTYDKRQSTEKLRTFSVQFLTTNYVRLTEKSRPYFSRSVLDYIESLD